MKQSYHFWIKLIFFYYFTLNSLVICTMNFISTSIETLADIRPVDCDEKPVTILDVFSEAVKLFENKDALCYKEVGLWRSYSWVQYYNLSRNLAIRLVKLGLSRGETVAIIGFNSYHWFISNMAAIMAGSIAVGVYTTNSAEICNHILTDSHATIIVAENDTFVKLFKSIDKNNQIKAIIQYTGQIDTTDSKIHSWNSLDDILVTDHEYKVLENIHKTITPNRCAALIYTSGTTGYPKGVMLSHDNIIWTAKKVCRTAKLHDCTVVSYLPLSHIASQMIDMYTPLVLGGTTWFAQPDALKGSLVNTLKECQPTIFLGVPRVWEKIREKIETKTANLTGIKKTISNNAKKVAMRGYRRNEQGNPSPPTLFSFFDKLVYQKVRRELGLTRCNLMLTGAAPVSKDLIQFFAGLNMHIFDIYGMSECSGPMTISFPLNFKLGSCGRGLNGAQLRIDPVTAEVSTFGRNVMMGYLNREEQTAETIDTNGWLRTGDTGRIDKDGYLFIEGRLKELIITSGGENIPPVRIEDIVKTELPLVSNCILVGENRNYLTLLLTLKCHCNANGEPTEEIDQCLIASYKLIDPEITNIKDAIMSIKFINYIDLGIKRYNQVSTSNAQKIQKFRILEGDFTINGGELGPTMKMKRQFILNKYKDAIDQLYST